MEYRSLGRTGVQVSALCLGCMNFGDDADEATSMRIIHRALDAGINFLDTANVYSRGESERIVGRGLANGLRDSVVLATKVHARMSDDNPNAAGNHRYHIIAECEQSLRRLGTDRIDLYQIHRPDPAVPVDETLRALDDLIRAGKVRYAGTSTFGAWQIVESLWASHALGLNRFVSEQPPYNLLDRRVERELLPACRTYGIAVIPWAPIAGGLLSGKYLPGAPRPQGARYTEGARFNRDNDRALSAVGDLTAYCAKRGVEPAGMALAWCGSRAGITSPIIGPRTEEQLDRYLAAASIAVSEDDCAALDVIFPPGEHHSEYYSANFGPNARWL